MRPRPAPGPWDEEPDDASFVEAGLPCRLWRNELGVWCGYVEVPSDHPCYGQHYNDICALDVHGGLTYASGHAYWGPGWWIGFDCGHVGDVVPALRIRFPWDVYRTMAFAEAETRGLARQLAAVAARQWV